ncbi:MAG TPA: hypothetical protein VII44_08175 [Puia sp.]
MNKASHIIVYALSFLTMSTAPFSPFPQTEISNGIIRARFYLPDPNKGYYRGTRFDWSGVIPDIEYKGHTYCGQWFDKYIPTLHDAIMGPVEAFSPLGYEQAAAGGSFVTIGVGVLLKEDNALYSPYKYHKILNTGKWKIEIKNDRVEFIHTLNDPEYSYEYKKTELLIKGKPELVLLHQLKNTGRKAIETNVYDHNLFLIDQQKVGPQFVINFPFLLVEKREGQGLGEMAAIKGKQIIINRPFLKSEQAYTLLEGYNKTAEDYHIQIENHKTGAGLRISADQPISKLVFWACSTILCPEPYIQLKIDPGETASWKISYQFYTCNIQP